MSTTTKAAIRVHTAGTNFACYATVKVGQCTVHQTRLFPFGFRGAAYTHAESWLVENAARLGVDTCAVSD